MSVRAWSSLSSIHGRNERTTPSIPFFTNIPHPPKNHPSIPRQAREELTRAEEARLAAIERADGLHGQLHEAREALQAVEGRLKALGEALGGKTAGRAGVEAEREGLIAQREVAANEAARLGERLEGERGQQAELKAQLAGVEKEVGVCVRVFFGGVGCAGVFFLFIKPMWFLIPPPRPSNQHPLPPPHSS